VSTRARQDHYYWIDYTCIDQNDRATAIPLLPLRVACCERFLRVETADYDQRAWCRLEPLVSHVYSFADHQVSIGLDFRNPWPKVDKETRRPIFDSREGQLTCLDDTARILPLIDVAMKTRPADLSEDVVSFESTTVKCYELQIARSRGTSGKLLATSCGLATRRCAPAQVLVTTLRRAV